ncbi:DUF3093 domain-containing protein [Actinocrispum wychmicini]|uniref:DUF3093 family protein n=1 Tax=Actinocrispum wychmicini TaxID=1213861 RepID=A0A4R2J2K4_9PSEU|nr:DUF3093 domain-containing protein [Actinocrispum wychmicini]TCO52513.1 DUF3093 family protein [Actinocrispum wychmicini]
MPDISNAHSERLSVTWWGWILPLVAAGLLAAEIHMGYPGVRAWLPYVVLLPFTAFVMFWMGRARVRVTDDELWVGDAHLPFRFVGEIQVLNAHEKRPALGRDLDPAAYVQHRGWIPMALRVELTDPDDPTPYWIFSTRSPEKLAELLRARSTQGSSQTAPGT